MAYKMTDKGKALIETKIIDGELYALCDRSNGKELWLLVTPPPEIKCVVCGYSGVAIDKHHIHGRKNSDVTVNLCSNCHREYHAGALSEEDVKKIFEGAA